MRFPLLLLSLLVLAGCGRTSSVHEADVIVHGNQGAPARPAPDQESRGLRITSTRIIVVTHGQASDPIWAVVKRGLEDAGRLNNVAVSYRAPDTYDVGRMRQMVEDAIADRPDGLVLSLPDVTALLQPIEEAERLGIPVVTINSGSNEFKRLGVLAHVGQPEYQAGVAAGERIAAAGAKTVLCVNHEIGNEGLSERCRGLDAGLRRHGGSSRVLSIDLQDPMDAQSTIAQALTDPDVDGIVTLGPTGAVPALAALRASGLEARVKLATFDLSNDVLRAIKDGRIQFAVDQQPYLEGYLPVVLLAERARHDLAPAPGGLIPTGPRFVTAANVDDTIRLSREGVR